MASSSSKINIQIGFTTDKTGLSQLETELDRIIAQSKMPGQEFNTELQKAAQTATTLEGILEKSFNADLGTLNVEKFNQELKKSGTSLSEIKAGLSAAGTSGATAFNTISSSILNSNIQLKQSNKLLDEMATTAMNTIKWGLSSGIFNIVTSSISGAVSYIESLDSSLNDIRIVTEKSSDDMAEFAVQANNAAKALGQTTTAYTNASLIYYQQGKI